MPSIVLTNITIRNIRKSGNVTFGDVLQINPKHASKSYRGSGSLNTGDFPTAISGISLTNVSDIDIMDSSNATNN